MKTFVAWAVAALILLAGPFAAPGETAPPPVGAEATKAEITADVPADDDVNAGVETAAKVTWSETIEVGTYEFFACMHTSEWRFKGSDSSNTHTVLTVARRKKPASSKADSVVSKYTILARLGCDDEGMSYFRVPDFTTFPLKGIKKTVRLMILNGAVYGTAGHISTQLYVLGADGEFHSVQIVNPVAAVLEHVTPPPHEYDSTAHSQDDYIRYDDNKNILTFYFEFYSPVRDHHNFTQETVLKGAKGTYKLERFKDAKGKTAYRLSMDTYKIL